MSFLQASELLPWFRFEFNLAPVPGPAWVTLGRCAAGLEQIGATAVFGPERAQVLRSGWLNAAVLGSLALDGIPTSTDFIAGRMAGSGAIPRARENEARVVDRMLRAVRAIEERARNGIDTSLVPADIRALHAGTIDVVESQRPGEFRFVDFAADLPTASTVAPLIETLCNWMNGIRVDQPYGSPLIMPFLKATITHAYLLWIAPFDAGTGRIARLVEFDLLVRCGVSPIVAALVWSRYAADPGRYARAVIDARMSPLTFVTWAAERYIEATSIVLEAVSVSAMRSARLDEMRQLSRHSPDGRLRAAVLGAAIEACEVRGGRPVPRFEIERHPSVVSAAEGLPTGAADNAVEALLESGVLRLAEGLVCPNDGRYRPFGGIDNPGLLPTAAEADYDSNVAWSGAHVAVRR